MSNIETHNKSNEPASSGGDPYEHLLEEAQAIKGVSLWRDARRRLRRNWVARLSLWFLITLGALVVLTPLLPLQSPRDKDLQRQFRSPREAAQDRVWLGSRDALKYKDESLVAQLADYDKRVDVLEKKLSNASGDEHQQLENAISNLRLQDPLEQLWAKPSWPTRALIRLRLAVFGDWCVPSMFGTDALGQDVLSRVFWGARVSLIVGIVATFVSLLIGVSYGATAGYFGGWVDNIMMRIVDIMYSVPFIFVVIFIITILREPPVKDWFDKHNIDRIVIFYVVIGAIYWLTMSRVVRGQVISLKNEQFVEAARTVGASRPRIIFRHLIPNVMGIVIVYLTLTIPAVMLFEAFLSFLGLGVEPPDVSWGVLVNEAVQAITPIKSYWWLVVFPGLALTTTLFALNFLGDGLRDALDPRMKNRV